MDIYDLVEKLTEIDKRKVNDVLPKKNFQRGKRWDDKSQLSESLNEGFTPPELQTILDQHEDAWIKFRESGELDQDLYEAVFEFFLNRGEIPYGTAKARTGDPYEWVSEKLSTIIDNEKIPLENAGMVESHDDDDEWGIHADCPDRQGRCRHGKDEECPAIDHDDEEYNLREDDTGLDPKTRQLVVKYLKSSPLRPYNIQFGSSGIFAEIDKGPKNYSSTYNLGNFENELSRLEKHLTRILKRKVNVTGSSISGLEVAYDDEDNEMQETKAKKENSGELTDVVWGTDKPKTLRGKWEKFISLDWLFGDPNQAEDYPRFNSAYTYKRLKRYGLDNDKIHQIRQAATEAMKTAIDWAVRNYNLDMSRVKPKQDSFMVYSVGIGALPDDQMRHMHNMARNLLRRKLDKMDLGLKEEVQIDPEEEKQQEKYAGNLERVMGKEITQANPQEIKVAREKVKAMMGESTMRRKEIIKEDVAVNISATGDDAVCMIQKLAGIDTQTSVAKPVQATMVGTSSVPPIESVEEADEDRRFDNSPNEEEFGVDAINTQGDDLNRSKTHYKKEYPGDNPMAVVTEEGDEVEESKFEAKLKQVAQEGKEREKMLETILWRKFINQKLTEMGEPDQMDQEDKKARCIELQKLKTDPKSMKDPSIRMAVLKKWHQLGC